MSEEVKVKVTADASQANAEMGKLKRGVDDVGKAAKSASGGFTDFLAGAGKGLIALNQGLELAGKAFSTFKKGFEMAEQHAAMKALEDSLPTGAVARIEQAFGGAAAKADILKLASKGLRGDFALSVPQMETVARAAEALGRRGFGTASENAQKLLKALQEGNVEKLDDFGIKLKATGNHALDVANAMGEFRDIVQDTGPVDAQTKSLREMNRTFDEMKLAIQAVFGAIMKGIRSLMDDAQEGGFIWDLAMTGGGGEAARAIRALNAKKKAYLDPMNTYRDLTAQAEGYLADMAMGPVNTFNDLTRQAEEAGKKGDRKRGGRGGGGSRGRARGEQYIGLWDPRADMEDPDLPAWMRDDDWGASRASSPFADFDAMGGMMGGAGAGAAAKETFDAFVAGSDMATAALGAFQNAATSAFAAFADGSKSFGEAAREASAQALKALSIEWAARSLGEAAMALGSLAFGDFAGASTHGKAAAAYAVAAAAAGGGAAALSPGGSGSSARGQAGGGYAKPGASNGGGGETVTNVFNFGDGFVGDKKAVYEFVSEGLRDARRRGAREDSNTRFKG